MTSILEKILGRKRVLVKENERAVALYKGEVLGILGPGEHLLAQPRATGWRSTRHDIGNAVFVSAYEKALFAKLPEVAAKHLHRRSAPGAARSP